MERKVSERVSFALADVGYREGERVKVYQFTEKVQRTDLLVRVPSTQCTLCAGPPWGQARKFDGSVNLLFLGSNPGGALRTVCSSLSREYTCVHNRVSTRVLQTTPYICEAAPITVKVN